MSRAAAPEVILMDSTATAQFFEVYGFRLSVGCNAATALEGIGEDFRFFSCAPGEEHAALELICQAPPLDRVPTGDAIVYTPRNVVYRCEGLRYIDYHGRGLGILEEASSRLTLYSEDP